MFRNALYLIKVSRVTGYVLKVLDQVCWFLVYVCHYDYTISFEVLHLERERSLLISVVGWLNAIWFSWYLSFSSPNAKFICNGFQISLNLMAYILFNLSSSSLSISLFLPELYLEKGFMEAAKINFVLLSGYGPSEAWFRCRFSHEPNQSWI